MSTVNDKERESTLYEVLWIPDLGRNLFSIGASNKHGNKTIIEADQIKIISKKNQTLMVGYSREQNLYTMNTRVVLPMHKALYAENYMQPLTVWHERLGHVNYRKLKRSSLEQSRASMSRISVGVLTAGSVRRASLVSKHVNNLLSLKLVQSSQVN